MNIEELMLERYGIKKQFCFSGVVFAGIVKNCRNIASMALIKFPPGKPAFRNSAVRFGTYSSNIIKFIILCFHQRA